MGYTAWIAVWANREAQNRKCTGVIVNIIGGSNATVAERTKRGIEMELTKYPKPIKGALIKDVNTSDMEKYLSSISNFESVHCMINSDNHLLIQAKPLEPVMRIFDGDRSYYINREGRTIDARAEFFTDVPVVYGHFTKDFTPKEVLPLVKYLEKNKELANITSMIEARDNRNLILVPRIRGHVINFGDTTRLAEKSQNLLLFYRKVMPYKGWETYDTVFVKFRGQVVATRRIKPQPVAVEIIDDDIDPEEETLHEIVDIHGTATTDNTNNTTNNPTTTP